MKKSEKMKNIPFIYNDLKSKIMNGEIGDGERLNESKLSEHYQMSKVHVNSALKLLENEGLAIYIARKGFFVKALNEHTFREIGIIRFELDKAVIEYFITIMTADDIDKLNHIVLRAEAFAKNGMTKDLVEEAHRYYDFLYTLFPYTRITDILQSLQEYIDCSIKNNIGVNHTIALCGVNILRKLHKAIQAKDAKEIERCLFLRDGINLNETFHRYSVEELNEELRMFEYPK